MTLLQGKSSDTRFPYMRCFCDAWVTTGGTVQKDCMLPHRFRAVCGRLGFSGRVCTKGRLLVCAGHRIESVAWPWCHFYEIVPVMWDLWPYCFDPFVKFIKRHHIKSVFCTSSQQVWRLKACVPGLQAVWMPEGIDVSLYPKGRGLADREIDILNYGRRVDWLNAKILAFEHFTRPVRFECGEPGKLVFDTFDELTAGIRNSKMAMCYPQCDTNPEKAGDVETLTQRYWECMLSGTLIIGRAPKELVDLCGYNPVIELGDNPCEQIDEVLCHLEKYQALADRNRQCAEEKADWSLRIADIRRELQI